MHRLLPHLRDDRVNVLVVGCGGTGSAIASGLVYLHQALLAFGHPGGIHATFMDGDEVSPTNCVRQAFTRSEVGLNKAVVITHRINSFWGLDWYAVPERLTAQHHTTRTMPSIVIGCVDTRAARRVIQQYCTAHRVDYWLDIGNDAEDGQFLLGQPVHGKGCACVRPRRLPTVAERLPELVDSKLDDANQPSCSALEALTRQAPFVNQVLANHALALLALLFRYGAIEHHGAFINLRTGRASAIPTPPMPQLSPEDVREIRMAAGHGCDPEVLQEAFDIDEFEFRQITRLRRSRAA